MANKLECLPCGKELKNFESEGVHPDDGLSFSSGGHYGSTFFDPMDGTSLVIVICDDCLQKARERLFYYTPTPTAKRPCGTYSKEPFSVAFP